MVITVQIGDAEPLRLRSKKEPILSGQVAGWPPYGTRLELENGPIEYFSEDMLSTQGADPVVKVTQNTVFLGTEPHPILSRAPSITSAKRQAQGGLALTWTNTADEIATEPSITAYHVYRNLDPGVIEKWELATRAPTSQTSWHDTDLGKSQVAEYLIVHAARCPFDYDLEGLLGAPVLIPAPL
jgi:hypothetical protein